MKKMMKVLAVACAVMMLMAACQKKEPEKPAENTAPQTQTETPAEDKKEPEADPKDEILKKAEEDREALLETVKAVVETYRGTDIPDYYAPYPDKEEYPVLESAENLVIDKGDDSCDVQVYVNLGGNSQKKMCVSLKHVESDSPWMVVATSFGDIKG